MATTRLDVRNLSCPLPILRANKAMKELIPGDILEVLATDPNAPLDFQAFCEATGSELVESREAGGVYTFVIRRLR
jgi:tRNA 2-thiouridine synthesizing protein A